MILAVNFVPNFRLVSTLVFLVLLQTGCSARHDEQPEMLMLSGATMGTTFNLKYYPTAVSLHSVNNVRPAVQVLLDSIEDKMSTYLPDSEISRFNRAPVGQWVELSEQTLKVVKIARMVSESTEGAFDISVAPLVNLWGFGPDFSTDSIPDGQAVENALLRVGYTALETQSTPPALLKSQEMSIDLSGVAKGYAVDQVAELFETMGLEVFMVEIGGEIRTRGKKTDGQSWKIGVESPRTDARSVQRILDVSGWAMATSGDYRNFFEKNGQRYSHTIDPVTGYPVTHDMASVTVLMHEAAQADALATALLVMGPKKALLFANTHKLAALFIVRDGTTYTEVASGSFRQYFN